MGFSQKVPSDKEIIGMLANTNAIILSPSGEINFLLEFGFVNTRRNDKQQIQRLPKRNKLPSDIVSKVGGTFGARISNAEPMTQSSVIGINNIPAGIVTQRDNGFGFKSEFSSIFFIPNELYELYS